MFLVNFDASLIVRPQLDRRVRYTHLGTILLVEVLIDALVPRCLEIKVHYYQRYIRQR